MTAMIAFLSITGGFVVFAVVHSLLAATPVRAQIQNRLRLRSPCYRLLYTVISIIGLAVLLIWLPPTGETLYRVARPWSLALYAIQALAAGAFLLAVRDFNGAAFLGLDCFRKAPQIPETLNVSGLFRYCRHPMYSAAMLFMLCNPHMTVGWLAYTVNISLYFVIGSLFEERRLLQQFGDAYRRYRDTTPRFVPRLWRIAGSRPHTDKRPV